MMYGFVGGPALARAQLRGAPVGQCDLFGARVAAPRTRSSAMTVTMIKLPNLPNPFKRNDGDDEDDVPLDYIPESSSKDQDDAPKKKGGGFNLFDRKGSGGGVEQPDSSYMDLQPGDAGYGKQSSSSTSEAEAESGSEKPSPKQRPKAPSYPEGKEGKKEKQAEKKENPLEKLNPFSGGGKGSKSSSKDEDDTEAALADAGIGSQADKEPDTGPDSYELPDYLKPIKEDDSKGNSWQNW